MTDESARPLRVYKYRPRADGRCTMPDGAQTIHVALQDGALTIWAIVCTDAEPVEWRFYVIGTGHPVPDGRHVGTYLDVWHVFQGRAHD